MSFFRISPLLNAPSVCSLPRPVHTEMWELAGRVSWLMDKSADLLTFAVGVSRQCYSTTYHALLPHTCMASLNLKHLQILTPKSPDRETPSGHHHMSTTAPLSSNNPVPHLISFLIFSAMHFTYFVSSIQKVNFMRVGIFFSFPYHSLLYFQHQD